MSEDMKFVIAARNVGGENDVLLDFLTKLFKGFFGKINILHLDEDGKGVTQSADAIFVFEVTDEQNPIPRHPSYKEIDPITRFKIEIAHELGAKIASMARRVGLNERTLKSRLIEWGLIPEEHQEEEEKEEMS